MTGQRIPNAAVEAAAKALYADSGGMLEDRWRYFTYPAERALAAAWPVIEQHWRNSIADDIEAHEQTIDPLQELPQKYRDGFADGMNEAARVARGEGDQ